MENWKTYKLGDISRIGDGAHSKVKRVNEGVLYLTSKNFKEGKLNLDRIDYISQYDYNRLFSSNSKAVNKPEEGDIILGIIGTLGNAYLYKDTDEFGISSSVALIRPDASKIFSKYLYYYITGNEFKHYQNAHNGASVQGYTNIPSLKSIPVAFPPLFEQQSIASILSALDDKIELNLQMNKTLEEMAMTLYKHWFVDFGPFQEGEFVESELGMIPKGWEVKCIGDLYQTTSGGTPSRNKSEYYDDGIIPWVKSKELYGNFVINTEEKITQLGLNKSSAKIIPAKSVLLAMYGATVGESSILSIDATCNQAICGIIEKNISYIYIFLYLRYYKTEILNQAVGSAQQNISQEIIKKFQILEPPKELKVFNNLESLFDIIEQNLIENQTLTTLRDTLLPKLISGEVRVKEAVKILEQVM